MTEELPVAVWSGTIRMFGIDVKCHRLSDGKNIIEADSFEKILKAMARDDFDAGDVQAFARFKAGFDLPQGTNDG